MVTMSKYRPNDCAYIYNPGVKPAVIMYDKVEYTIKAKQIVPFLGTLCDWFVSQFPAVRKLELNEVEIKKSKNVVEAEPEVVEPKTEDEE